MDTLADLFATLKANAVSVLALLGTIVTGILTYRSTNRKTDLEGRKMDLDEHASSRKVRIEEGDFYLKREAALKEREDRLVAHLESQIDKIGAAQRAAEEQASKERAELRNIISGQSERIGVLTRTVDQLKARVSQLIEFIKAEGKEPPPPRHAEVED
ncbi:hypothetical protein [Methylobacterium soli]|uniref:Uncharacterized protein n=1 Tax=Methylobacterium soli TaxID=553447 RepID=A0A6L3SUK8_9HYPH|nr:hypothetical protein [Methylobacterium soli]KAB1076514.1 hypothetical protein F6X53_22680 [Methylobacterium soli]GJE44849.1 hypothetical protein AEGHOMDF_4040 [Methylobacterium soli]